MAATLQQSSSSKMSVREFLRLHGRYVDECGMGEMEMYDEYMRMADEERTILD